jgi:hypothetical protein
MPIGGGEPTRLASNPGNKHAALHAQYVNDPVVLDAVNDIEVLTSNLSNKIWQKIMILDTLPGAEQAQPAGGGVAVAKQAWGTERVVLRTR